MGNLVTLHRGRNGSKFCPLDCQSWLEIQWKCGAETPRNENSSLHPDCAYKSGSQQIFVACDKYHSSRRALAWQERKESAAKILKADVADGSGVRTSNHSYDDRCLFLSPTNRQINQLPFQAESLGILLGNSRPAHFRILMVSESFID